MEVSSVLKKVKISSSNHCTIYRQALADKLFISNKYALDGGAKIINMIKYQILYKE